MRDERDLLRLSQFIDDELPPEELHDFLNALLECPELQMRWHRYRLIQEALRLQDSELLLKRFRHNGSPFQNPS